MDPHLLKRKVVVCIAIGLFLAGSCGAQPNPPSTPPPDDGFVEFLQGRAAWHPEESYNPESFFKEHISGYQPLYFIAGPRSPNAKFQISFKYRLLNENGTLAKKVPWLTGLHLAYTQMSLWDWGAPSAPFLDTSYEPEILYAWPGIIGGGSSNWFRLDGQLGFQHESNGKSGADSRGMNLAYLQPTFIFGKPDGLQLSLGIRAWTYVGGLDGNPDIADYRGYAEMRAIVGWTRGLQISALERLGKTGSHLTSQINVTYPLMVPPTGSLSIYLMAQYFTGYGESLLNYNKPADQFRAGFSLYR